MLQVLELCPTCWTVRAEALQSALENYRVLMELWEGSVEVVNDTEMKARVLSVQSAMHTFDFFTELHWHTRFFDILTI